jgi:hypothetical protein
VVGGERKGLEREKGGAFGRERHRSRGDAGRSRGEGPEPQTAPTLIDTAQGGQVCTGCCTPTQISHDPTCWCGGIGDGGCWLWAGVGAGGGEPTPSRRLSLDR